MNVGIGSGGGADSQKPITLQFFCRKLHENEITWTGSGGGRIPSAP